MPRRPGAGAIVVLAVAVVALLAGSQDGERPRRDRGPADHRPAGAGRDRPRPRPATVDRDRARPRPDRSGGDAAPSAGATARVVDVVDGDTIEVSLGGRVEDVRYIGVDTPESVAPGEPVECFGRRAGRFNAALVTGGRARLVFDDERRDAYGRLLAYVYAGGTFVNAELVRRGYARTLAIPPNTDMAARLDRIEQRAGNAGRGLWGAC